MRAVPRAVVVGSISGVVRANIRNLSGSVILTLFACLLPLVTTASVSAAEFPLADAAQRQDWDAVRRLLNQRVDVNARQPDGASALAWTAHWDEADVADLLIHAGA